jgi:hypothetical protein
MTYNTHSGNERAYIRDIILGINDGLISTLLLTIGIYASGFSITAIILTIISSSIVGMISMGLGEYLATKSQAEVTKAELEMEKEHIKEFYSNAPSTVTKLVQSRLSELATQGGIQPPSVACSECAKTYEAPVEFDFANFFGNGS